MNRLDTADRIRVMQAFADGKLIEARYMSGVWKECGSPNWDWKDHTYRVAIEPRTFFVVENMYSSTLCTVFKTLEEATRYTSGNPSLKVSTVREVAR